MKKTIKIITVILVQLSVCYVCFSYNFCVSDTFKFTIDTIGIPQYNVYGLEINEEVYNAYNVFSYGKPEYLEGKNSQQRWKNSNHGLWSRYIGRYCGYGTRGEYNLLGLSYSGTVINNYYFPVDKLPDSTPDSWNYCYVPGGRESWSDTSKYKYAEQLEFMKNTKLLFNDISSRDNSDNPEKIREYNITVNSIGLDNSRLDTASTWKTNGIVYTRRYINGGIRYAVFLTPPIAASADIKSKIDMKDDNYTIKSDQDELQILISYGCEMVNLSGYAKEEHIKQMTSNLYINGKKVSEISGNKTAKVGNKYMIAVSRKNLTPNTNNPISIKVDSYSNTEFVVDGLMRNTYEKTIFVYLEQNYIEKIKEEKIVLLERKNNELVISPLAQTIDTKNNNSQGITEAGRHLAIKLSKPNNSIDIKSVDVYLDGRRIETEEIKRDSGSVCVILQVPKDLFSTVLGWKSLREMYGNYFNISKDDIGKRIASPHDLTIKYSYGRRNYEDKFLLDTIDDYISNMNYILNIGNSESEEKSVGKKVGLEEWMGS